jgi:hypothetical protein
VFKSASEMLHLRKPWVRFIEDLSYGRSLPGERDPWDLYTKGSHICLGLTGTSTSTLSKKNLASRFSVVFENCRTPGRRGTENMISLKKNISSFSRS